MVVHSAVRVHNSNRSPVRSSNMKGMQSRSIGLSVLGVHDINVGASRSACGTHILILPLLLSKLVAAPTAREIAVMHRLSSTRSWSKCAAQLRLSQLSVPSSILLVSYLLEAWSCTKAISPISCFTLYTVHTGMSRYEVIVRPEVSF